MEKADNDSIETTIEEAERLLLELEHSQTNQPQPTPSLPVSPGTQIAAPSRPFKPGLPTPWIVLGSLVTGALFVGVFLTPYLNPPQPSGTKNVLPAPSRPDIDPMPSSPPQPPSYRPVPPSRQTPVIPKGQHEGFQPPRPTPQGAWGPASAYKFGQLPSGSYPDSCAFSQTDPEGKTITSRSTMEYWACRDDGGNPADGYPVTWADGKTTKYVFGPSGSGSVVATNGNAYPVEWRNDFKNGTNVIVVSHQDGATSWIPGHVKN